MDTNRRRAVSVAAALVTTALVSWQTWALPDRKGADSFHALVRSAAEKIPLRSGSWIGTDMKPAEAAVRLLKPNVLHERKLTNLDTGLSVTVLLVHCGDCRDMLGHYPPVCYTGQGWRLANKTDWQMTQGEKLYNLPEYEFVAVRSTSSEGLFVRNAMLLPGVGLGRDMDDVTQASRNVSRRFFGSGQIQIIFGQSVTQDVRDEATAQILKIYGPVIDAITRFEKRGDSHE